MFLQVTGDLPLTKAQARVVGPGSRGSRERISAAVSIPGAMDYYEARGSAWTPGFLCSAGSNVDGSTGADSDLMSFYCTTAATTWKDPKQARARKNEGTGDTSTGYIKNFAHIQDPLSDEPPDQKFLTTYKRVNNEREDRIQTTDATSRTIQSDCAHTGSFATASCPSPIKWGDEKYRRFGFPSKPMLDKRKKRDPTEWENNGVGPSDFSTSFGVSWTAPNEQEDKCNARASLGTSSSSTLEKASLTSGWRENNTNREHPWIHPGVPETTETTYRMTNRIPAKRGARSEIAPMVTSGYSRSARKIVFGRNLLLPDEKISTTHLNYLAGRTNFMTGTVVELKPNVLSGDPGFAQSGFCKNLPHPMEVFPRTSEELLPPQVLYSTSASSSFMHPSKFRSAMPGLVDGAAGLPSAFGRAVIPVNRLHSVGAPTLNQLHPSVAQLRARRDPYYYDSKTFKITSETRPWGEPSNTFVSAPFG